MKLKGLVAFTFVGLFTACALVSVGMAAFAYTLTFPQQTTISNGISPHGVISITFDDSSESQYLYAWPLMEARGLHGTFYIVTDWLGLGGNSSICISINELKELQNAGNEIGSHSKSHPDFTELSDQQIRNECQLSKQFLESYGLNVENFAYPYSDSNSHVDSIVQQYYRSGRLVWGDLMSLPYTGFQVSGFEADYLKSGKLDALKAEVDQVYSSQAWMTFCFHVFDPTDKGQYCTSVNDFAAFLDYAIQKGVAIMTVHEALLGIREQTKISIYTSASSELVGFKAEVNGTLADLDGNGISDKTVVLYYTFQGISEWIPLTSSITGPQGNYSCIWMPPTTGYFTIEAEWVGNETHLGASKNTTLNVVPYEDKYVFSVASNSTISALVFNSTSQELSFVASGPSGTTGFAQATIAKTLLEDTSNLKIYLDENPLGYLVISTDDSWIVRFNYTHSTHRITIAMSPLAKQGSSPFPTIAGLVIVLTIVAAMKIDKDTRRRDKHRIYKEM